MGRREQNNNNSIRPPLKKDLAIRVNVLPFCFPRLPVPKGNAGIKYAGQNPPYSRKYHLFNGMLLERNCFSAAQIIMNEAPYHKVCL